MSLNIYIAHSGEHLLADPVASASPDSLKTWIVRNTSIPIARQILMTARGKNVKTQTLATETEIFVYDRQYVSEPADFELPELPALEPFQPQSPPASLTDQNDLQSWRNLFMTRRTWALDLSTRCGTMDKNVKEHNERTDVINRAVGVALENLKSHVGTLEHRFQEAQTWANNLLEEQQAALDGWQRALQSLENIPARKDFPMLGRPSTPKKDKDQPTGTLRDFIDLNEVQQAGSDAAVVSPRFAGQARDLEQAVSDIASDTQALVDEVVVASADGEDGLLEEVETLAKKIGSDYEHVLGLPNNQKMLANVSRLALNHTQNLLPSLLDLSGDLHHALQQAVRRRAAAEKTALQHMRTISFIESRLADAHAQLVNFGIDSNAFDILYAVFQMPMIYGSVLIESARRREWNDKIKSDSLTLAEEMAVLRDEEQRRRKKWVKTMGDFISFGDSTTPGIEINLHGQDNDWPEVNRTEIETYIEDLRNKHSLSNIADDLAQQLKDLDAPTRQQRRRAKAFKNGSVFDLSRSSMLLRGDDMVRSLQEEKGKLEERLRGSDSRIRKLEDLLHRQSHMSRPSSGNFGHEFPLSPASPHPDALSRRSSVSSRRVSMTQSPEDRALVQRIVSLEAELNVERETVQRLHKEAHAERQSNSDKYQEAQSTKQDLIGNLEARQREFEDERRYLEAEVKKFRLRTEEVEEELDRLVDGREHEKQEVDERILQLETDLQTAHEKSAEATRTIGDLNERVESLQQNEQSLQAKIEDFERQHGEWTQKDQDHYNALHSAFMNLSPGGSVPIDVPGIIKAIEVLSEGLSIHVKSAEDSAAKLTTENKALEERISQLEYELEGRLKVADDREAQINRLTEELKKEKSDLHVVKAELDQERSKLNTLQSQVSAGESGSDALREQIAEEERKQADLARKLADAESLARDLKSKEADWERKVEEASKAEQHAVARLDARGTKSHDLSKQLYAQVEKLERMLEQLGFAIIQQDGRLIVQRASKLSASSSLGESIAQSGIVTARPDSGLLGWMHADTPEDEEARFQSFMDSLNHFDVAVFGDVVVKRVKDIEILARKWQKEAKGYREKYHRVQSEAHEKIAYRSFKEGDLALFLPTRNQAIRSWAAFNVGAPHYFLREQDSHKLQTRDWLLARISKIEERVVDLSKSLNGVAPDRRSLGDASDGASIDENPFELSDGLRWYLLDATEEKPGAPATPGIAKSTVASAHVDAKGSIRLKRPTEESTVAQTLSRSLESRRNSSNSKRGTPTPSQKANDSSSDLVRPAEADAGSQPRESAPIFDEVRRDLLLGP
ncbi:Autophagy-related protein 11 [Penicillium cataractarum]|uniref:Autophagy-related protein 11 n=1 Tax=Penicillium cataractarum TaxID=2100454 RepID=A0A9X0B745_9EURO|nr:Autophagy-related protein 11 [Penicillium cataractarum]KAJ5390576.1 Autophagy-related protein 11 [Penicillium cataractarum]